MARIRKRKWLSEATYVSLSSNDRGRFNFLAFKCDIGRAAPGASTELGARHGLIRVGGMTEEGFPYDYGVSEPLRVVECWRRTLIRFFTPLHHASHDAAAYDSFRLKVVLSVRPPLHRRKPHNS